MAYWTNIADHTTRALDHLLSQFDESPGIQALLTVLADEVQALEDVLEACYSERLLSTAIGAQLDQYGALLVLPRNGLDDEAYRAALYVKITAHRGSGTPESMLTVIAVMLESWRTQGVRYIPLYPGGFSLGYVLSSIRTDVSDDLRDTLISLLEKMPPAGVSWELRETSEHASEAPYFTFDTDSDPDSAGFDEAGTPGVWNTRVLYPVPTQWPFPDSARIGVWATSDRYSWLLESPTDSTEQPTWQGVGESDPGLEEVAANEAPTYMRESGVVERGALFHDAGTATPVSTDGGEPFFLATGQFTLHIRLRITNLTPTQGLVTQWDPVHAARCGLFYTLANGLEWYESGSSLLDGGIDGAWHTVTIVRNAITTYLYLDRKLLNSNAHGGAAILEGAPLIGARSATNGSTIGPSFADALDAEWTVIAAYGEAQDAAALAATWDAIDAIDGAIA